MHDATHHRQQAIGTVHADLPVGALAPAMFAMVPLDINAETGGESVEAYANHGRWCIDCPDCNGAQLTSPEDRRFLCNRCGNVANGRLFRPVVWPKSHAKIAALLDERPDHTLRNWSPGETLADLKREHEILTLGAPVTEQDNALTKHPGRTAKAWADYKAAKARHAEWTPEQHEDPTKAMLSDVAAINDYESSLDIMQREAEK